jgi:hypothetical protein
MHDFTESQPRGVRLPTTADGPTAPRRPKRGLRSKWGLFAAIPVAFLLVMAFVGTALGHETIATASFACDGTVTWHVDDWTTDNSNNQAIADIVVSYSLDGAPFHKIGDFSFTADNFLVGFDGTFSGDDATHVLIRVDLQAGTTWGDGQTSSGPWFSAYVARDTDCAQPTPTPTPKPTPTPTPTPTHGTGPNVNLLNPVCDGNVPYLTYDVTGAGDGDTVTITWHNPAGPDVVQTGLPLSGRVLWPGAVVDSHGNPIDWPGWRLVGGVWIQGDQWDWVRPSVEVIITIDSGSVSTTGHMAGVMIRAGSAVVAAAPVGEPITVAYPPSSPNCNANPPQGGVEAATGKPKVTPPSTSTSDPASGSSDPGFAIVIAGLIGTSLSILFLTPRRKAVPARTPERKD